MTVQAYWERMNQRERLLAGVVAGVIFILLNLFVWSWLLGIASRGRVELAARRATRNEQSVYLREKKMWKQRDEWLQQHLPSMKNSAEASTLLDQLKQTGEKYKILIENPAIGTGETTPYHQSVFVSLDTKSPWQPLVHFLYDIQQPDAFIVFDSVNLVIDSGDQTMMRGKFKITKWFAPVQKPK